MGNVLTLLSRSVLAFISNDIRHRNLISYLIIDDSRNSTFSSSPVAITLPRTFHLPHAALQMLPRTRWALSIPIPHQAALKRSLRIERRYSQRACVGTAEISPPNRIASHRHKRICTRNNLTIWTVYSVNRYEGLLHGNQPLLLHKL